MPTINTNQSWRILSEAAKRLAVNHLYLQETLHKLAPEELSVFSLIAEYKQNRLDMREESAAFAVASVSPAVATITKSTSYYLYNVQGYAKNVTRVTAAKLSRATALQDHLSDAVWE